LALSSIIIIIIIIVTAYCCRRVPAKAITAAVPAMTPPPIEAPEATEKKIHVRKNKNYGFSAFL
jgi:hypothetical protein